MYKTNKIPFNKKKTHGLIDSRKINVSSLNLTEKKKKKRRDRGHTNKDTNILRENLPQHELTDKSNTPREAGLKAEQPIISQSHSKPVSSLRGRGRGRGRGGSRSERRHRAARETEERLL